MADLSRLDGRPSWLLGRAAARSHRLVTDAFAEQGMRGYHFRVLAALDEHGPSSQADIGRAAGIDRSDVVATIDDLLRDDLVRRAADPLDRRRNVVTITPAGRRALARLDDRLDEVQSTLLAPLSERERATLIRLLTKLAAPSETPWPTEPASRR